jgi:pyridoxine kinase
MGRVLAISSLVARGHVGLSAMVPALQRLGHEVIAMPTVLLSNHPGHKHSAGELVSPETMLRMLDALDANGWLAGLDAVITGYLPTPSHVDAALAVLDRVSAASPGTLVLIDPVLGDDPKGLYIAEDAAIAIRDRLLPRATLTTPNRFELAWLSGRPVSNAVDAVKAARLLATPMVIATSIPEGQHALLTVYIDDEDAMSCSVRRRQTAPNGTGDLMTALIAGHLLDEVDAPEAVGLATAGVQAALAASQGRNKLDLFGRDADWTDCAPLPMVAL